MANFMLCTFFTEQPPYPQYGEKWKNNVSRFKLPHYAEFLKPHQDVTWIYREAVKPAFIKGMLNASDKHIVWLDVDSQVHHYPYLFTQIPDSCPIAVHYLDGKKLLGGTIYIKNDYYGHLIVDEWKRRQEANPSRQGDADLQNILDEWGWPVYHLPPQYCQIFDTMRQYPNPVIEHYQASRNFNKKNVVL